MEPLVRPGADETSTGQRGRSTRIRAGASVAVTLVVVAAAGYAVYSQRHSFVDTLDRMGVWTVIVSATAGLLGVAATFPMWREVLHGLGVTMPWGAGSRVFFVSQLGKYLPGSVWPVLMQMEAGRGRGASRRTILAANLITLVMSCTVGLVVACLLLPLHDAHALGRYWWALIALPFLLGLLHPRALPALLDRLFALVHRPPLGERLDVRSGIRACGWSIVSWVALGVHVGVLCAALGHGSFSAYMLSIGAMALAFSVGILFVPAPAGAGIRDIVLKFVLASMLMSGQALAVVVASRVILIGCDLAVAGVATASRSRDTNAHRLHPSS